MRLLNTMALLLSLASLPNIAYAQSKVILTCPNSGKGTPSIELTLTAQGGFELAKDQTMFLPLQFAQAKMDTNNSQKGVRLSCVYNSFTENGTEQKTVTLIAYTSPTVTKCNIKNSIQDGKANQIVCESAS